MEVVFFMLATLIRPSEEFRGLSKNPRPGIGLEAMLLMATVFAAFDLVLWNQGHIPSRPIRFIDPADHYLYQALYTVPMLVGAWLIYVLCARFLGGLVGGRGNSRAMMGALGLAYAVPVLVAFVLPDIVIYFRQGHDAMGHAMRYYVPFCLLWSWALGAFAVQEVEGLPLFRSVIVAGLAFSIQGAPLGLLLR